MNQDIPPNERPVSDRLHPLVYSALITAALTFALAVWTFAGDAYTDYLLVIVSGFALVAISIPVILSRVGRKERGALPRARLLSSFRRWMSSDFETWQYHVRAANAAVEVLLPLSAIAAGMLAISIVLHVISHAGT